MLEKKHINKELNKDVEKVAEDVAQKMLKSNQHIELIAKITGLSIEEIQKLKTEIKGNK